MLHLCRGLWKPPSTSPSCRSRSPLRDPKQDTHRRALLTASLYTGWIQIDRLKRVHFTAPMSEEYFQPERAGGTQGPCVAIGGPRAWLLLQRCLTNISWPHIQPPQKYAWLSVTCFWRKRDWKFTTLPLYAPQRWRRYQTPRVFVADVSTRPCAGAAPSPPSRPPAAPARRAGPSQGGEGRPKGCAPLRCELPCRHEPQRLFGPGPCCRRRSSWTYAHLTFQTLYFYTAHENQRWRGGRHLLLLQLLSSRRQGWAAHVTDQHFNRTGPHKTSRSSPTNCQLGTLTLIHPFIKMHLKSQINVDTPM